MNLKEKYDEAKEILKKYNQSQILNHYDSLSDENKEKLLEQILNIDFKQINNLYESTKKKVNFSSSKIKPISYIDKEKLTEADYEKYKKLGTEAIKNGKYAVVTMAGGQGTRLGHKGPKGTFDLDLDSHKSIFEILTDRLRQECEMYNTIIQWYIMTSKENNIDTVNFFEENNYFGYNKNAITFFIQGQLPMCGEDGKVLIGEDGLIKEAADGHGGIFESMRKNSIITDIENKKIQWAFIGPVDNVLVNMVDPILLGICIDKQVLAGGKSVVKAYPEEKVGVFCKKNGKPSVVEYTEITEEMSKMVDEKGELVFGESHINCNLFNIKTIKTISNEKLPYHSAHKKAKYINEKGDLIEPIQPNAFKFEAFIFDTFDKLEDMAILRVKREEEFAPVKNAEGKDSPETARELYKKFYRI